MDACSSSYNLSEPIADADTQSVCETQSQLSKAAVLSSRAKPAMPLIDVESIPHELKCRARWLGWKWEWHEQRSKWNKPPVNARTGYYATSTDPKTWCTFDQAMAGVEAGLCDGVGFALGIADDVIFAGIDLDDCRNTVTGQLSPMAEDILTKLDTYCEVSPSQTGCKALCIIAKAPGSTTKNGDGTVEIYSKGRYFTVTGQRLPNSSSRVEQRQEQLSAVWEEYICAYRPKSQPKPKSPMVVERTDLDEDSTIALTAMLLIAPKETEDDGSSRLFAVACRAVEHDLSDDAAIATIYKYADTYPFPTNWTEEHIAQRLRDAEKKEGVERGAAWRRIDCSISDLAVITPRAWRALRYANKPPTLFRHGGIASRVEFGDESEPVIKALDCTRMRHHLARSASWIKKVKRGSDYIEKGDAPPMAVVNDVLATPNYPLPVLSRIVEAPVFAADCTLQITPGYHAASHTYYVPADGFVIPNVPSEPTPDDIELASSLLCDELLGDFPFVGDAERAHAVALLLLPFARDLISGPTPLHLFEKPAPGTGATLLVDMLTFPAIGRSIPAMTEGRDEDEWRKRITAKLRSGSSFILIDNLRRRLDSAAVAAGLTATTWEDRILGVSEVARLPVRCAWIATGNNPEISTEISRRTVRIRMDAKHERPWLRDTFRHPKLRQWASHNRAQLVWAALTLIRAWIVAGQPSGQTILGMYERWAEVMGGILEVANVEGFLANRDEFYAQSDAEGTSWSAFIAAWWENFNSIEKTVKDLWQFVQDEACLSLGGGSEQSQKVMLGKMLADRKDRVFELDGEQSKVVLRQGQKRQGAYRWQLTVPTLAV